MPDVLTILHIYLGDHMKACTHRAAAAAIGLLAFATPAAAQIDLNLVATYPKSAPFGLAWDGTNIWWSNNAGTAFEMSTGGVDS